MAAISTHPSLRTLKFRDIDARGVRSSSNSKSRKSRTKSLANMLLVNTNIDAIPFYASGKSFTRNGWNALVAPRLEFNLCWKRLPAIQSIHAASTRAATVARALVRVKKNPSLVWMVLSQNYDVICSYLDAASTRDDDSVSVSHGSVAKAQSLAFWG
jgi:hypothetical protein